MCFNNIKIYGWSDWSPLSCRGQIYFVVSWFLRIKKRGSEDPIKSEYCQQHNQIDIYVSYPVFKGDVQIHSEYVFTL